MESRGPVACRPMSSTFGGEVAARPAAVGARSRLVGVDEIHLVLVRPLGADVDPLCSHLESVFAVFGYTTERIHLSDFINELKPGLPGEAGSYEYYASRMDAGDQLRDESSGGVLALFSIHEVERRRRELLEKGHEKLLFIHDSAMHPDELRTFRQAYGKVVFVVSINRSQLKRQQRLVERFRIAGLPEAELEERAAELIARDLGRRKDGNKRRLSFEDTFVLADVFIDGGPEGYGLDPNSRESNSNLIKRFARQIFSYPHGVPSPAESMMSHAYMAALSSGAVSRTVGAAISSQDGTILAVGRNDVPKFGGGLYLGDEEGGAGDAHHIFSAGNFELLPEDAKGADSNDLVKLHMLKELFENAAAAEIIELREPESLLENLLGANGVRQSRFFEVIAYGRTVHAEMDAITTAARSGIAIKDSILYSTTFPCHECARHIIAAGIKKVIFVQPYPKSRISQLHSDSMELIEDADIAPKANCVTLKPFIGFATRSMGRLFSLEARKTDDPGDIAMYGRTVEWSAGPTAELRNSIAGDDVTKSLRDQAIQAAEVLAAETVRAVAEVLAAEANRVIAEGKAVIAEGTAEGIAAGRSETE